MKKNSVKIVLDIIMVLLLVLMYNLTAVKIKFHEVGGLIVCGLFLIHKVLNWSWITGVSKKIFKKSLPAKTRFGYIVDLLLLICMAFIAVSGIMISKVILTNISSSDLSWKVRHYFVSSLALALSGVHVGLHWSFIKSMFVKAVKFPQSIAKPLGIMLLAVTLVFGGYSLATSNFTGWLTGPISMMRMASFGQLPDKAEGNIPADVLSDKSGDIEQLGENESVPKDLIENSDERPIDLGRAMSVIATYGSIIAVFASLTVFIERLNKKIKKRKQIIRSV